MFCTRVVAVAILVAGPITVEGCSSAHTGNTSAPSAQSAPAATAAGGDQSAFCVRARDLAPENLAILANNDNPDLQKLLANLDQLDGIAPPDLKPDFDTYDQFSHAFYGPTHDPAALTNPSYTSAVKHVSSYYASTCHIRTNS